MPGFLLDLISLVIALVVVAVVIGVLVWALATLFPQAPAILTQALYVLGVLVALYLIVAWIYGLPVAKRMG